MTLLARTVEVTIDAIEPEVRKRVGDLGQHEQTEWKVEAVDVYRLAHLLLQRVDLGGHLLQVEEDAVGRASNISPYGVMASWL